jgi:mycothiol synthase
MSTEHATMSDIAGLEIRPFRDDTDYDRWADLIRAASQHDGIPFLPTAENIRIDTEGSAGIDPRLDVVFAEVDGVPVGAAEVRRTVRDGVATFEMGGTVRPDMRRRGIGRRLLDHNLARTAERVALEPAGAPVQGGTFIEDVEVGALVLVASAGFQPIRHFFLMRRRGLTDVPDAPLPDGLEFRPVTKDQHRAIFDAEREAFRDHWNEREWPDEEFETTHAFPEIDTGLWVVAWDGDKIAGVVQSWVWPDENARLGVKRGWLEHISVRRPWRRRGVGRAITAEALARLRAAGLDEAMLGVDSESPTGALGLYEGLGFEVHSRATAFHLDLPRRP